MSSHASSNAGPRSSLEVAAVAASAGGVTALGRLVTGLDADFPIPLVVVQHLDPRHETVIADVLGRRSQLRVTLAADGDRLTAGTVHVAPPDHHLVVGPDGRLSLVQTELVHFVRPSADVLFESLAESFGDRVMVCVLTGTGRDGAQGVAAVHERGGTVIVEDPGTAEFAGMPGAAVATGEVDHVVPLDAIAALMTDLAGQR